MSYKTKPGAHPSIQINVLNYLPKDRYLLALKRVREAIANGRELVVIDDDTPGSKETGCSWGLCRDSAQTWPDAQDHIFPMDFERHGRCSSLHLGRGENCPMDRDSTAQPSGCFYRCKIFKPKRGDTLMTREEALRLYDETIKKVST